MQSISPLVASDFLAKVKRPRYKFEIHVGAAWVNLCDLNGVYYLKTISVNPSGAGATPDVMAGTWSAEIRNPGGIFHPLHPTSDYADYFRIGREVRISIGGNIGGADRYYQRLIGYMDAPTFNHKSRSVSLSGCDYSKQLADTALRSPDNFWGSSATYSTIASVMVLGSEIYDEADAMEIGVHEANNVTNWVVADGTFESFTDGGGGSTYVGLLQPIDDTDAPVTYDDNIGNFTVGTTYVVSFNYKRTSPWTPGTKLSCYIYESGTYTCWGSVANLSSATWAAASFQFVCPKTTTARMTFKMSAQYKAGAVDIQVDQISIKPITGDAINAPYELPSASNGPYLAVLDDAAICFGQANNEWIFDEATNLLTFSEKKIIAAGTNNLVVYYFTTQDIIDVLGDVLSSSGLYVDRAAALAAMDYTDPDISLDKVWFEPRTMRLAAIKQICERSNYRFWFAYDGTPTFKPAPVAGSPVFSFPSFGNLSALDDKQDLEQIRNRIVIEGIERGAFVTAKDKETSRFTGTASDGTSIDVYLEHTETIQNHLFQDQNSIDAMCAVILAERKDPVWFATLNIPNPVPLEVGDTISWFVDFATVNVLSGGTFLSTPGDTIDGGSFLVEPEDTIDGGTFLGSATLWVTGIIRAISISNSTATYTCEITAYE